MCLIIVRNSGTAAINEEKLKIAIKNNPHGWGVAFWGETEKEIKVVRSLDMQSALPSLRLLEKEDIEFVFHVRYATQGEKDLDNCHPYDVPGVGVLFHNGTMAEAGKWMKGKSDTWHFARRLQSRTQSGKHLEDSLAHYKKLIDDSRLVIMNEKDGSIRIVGEIKNSYSTWNVIGGNYFSNQYAMEEKVQHHYNWGGGRYYSNASYVSSYKIETEFRKGNLVTLPDLDGLSSIGFERLFKDWPQEMFRLIRYGNSLSAELSCGSCQGVVFCDDCWACWYCEDCTCAEEVVAAVPAEESEVGEEEKTAGRTEEEYREARRYLLGCGTEECGVGTSTQALTLNEQETGGN
jgi:predicted glutamine amidotransferase